MKQRVEDVSEVTLALIRKRSNSSINIYKLFNFPRVCIFSLLKEAASLHNIVLILETSTFYYSRKEMIDFSLLVIRLLEIINY